MPWAYRVVTMTQQKTSPDQPQSQAALWADPPRTDQLQRSMSARHLMMISFGGVIGTGLFLSSGWTISQAGPIGTILAYALGAVIVYLVAAALPSTRRDVVG